MKKEHICILCNKPFIANRDYRPNLTFCPECKKVHKDYVDNEIKKEIAKVKSVKQQYWKDHPEEYKQFLAERKAKSEQTKIARYGSLENAEKYRREKQLKTLKEKYPDEDWEHIVNLSQLSVARKNIRAAAAKKDEEYYKERKKKSDKTKIEKYGSLDNAHSSMVAKQKSTMMEKYGVVSSFNLESCDASRHRTKESDPELFKQRKIKSDQTKIEKYGSLENAYAAANEHIRDTMMEKYGVTSGFNLDSCIPYRYRNKESNPEDFERRKLKAQQTKIKNYGSLENAREVATQRRKKTYLDKYGVVAAAQVPKIKEKMIATTRERYGVDNISCLPGIREKANQTIHKDIIDFEKANSCTILTSLVEKYGQGWLTLNLPRISYKRYSFISNDLIPQIEEYFKQGNTSTSRSEKEILDFVRSIYDGEIIENSRLIINPLELDIYLPEKKLAIEYNGDFWHSSESTPRRYHENKSKACEEKGIRLIHIYECEWKYSSEKIKSLLRLAIGVGYSKIGARQCEVRKISNKEAKPFNEKNHLQGHKNATVTYGLFYKGELQQLMSFSNCKYNRNLRTDNSWEIVRGCPGSNNQVVGGVSKLFRAFIRDYDPDSVFSYCDFNKFDGRGYEAIGMKFVGYTGPDKFYVDKSEHKVNRNPGKRQKLEETMMFTIYGAGSKKYLWERPINA